MAGRIFLCDASIIAVGVSMVQICDADERCDLIAAFGQPRSTAMGRTRGVIVSAVLALIASTHLASGQAPTPPASHVVEFNAFLEELHQAHDHYINGRPEPFKALWSRRPDVTIFGGFGAGERGWDSVGPRLDWASQQFEKGARSREVISTVVTPAMGYVVQIERVRYTMPGQANQSLFELRVTMIARREPEGWRLIHRHGDSQMTKQAPK